MAETVVNIPGVGRVRFPETMSREEINSEAGRLYDEAIDKTTGAGATARMAAGTARTSQDKLATIRQYYPDAQPYGDGNFVFTDPKTGRPTMFNEQNSRMFGIPLPTVGDIAGATPEIVEAVGGAMGAAAGTTLGPGGTVAGAGLGGGGARTLWDMLASQTLGVQSTRSPGAVLRDTALDIGLNASGQAVGEAIPRAVQAIAGPVSQRFRGMVTKGEDVAQAGQRQGVFLPLGVASNNPMVQRVEAASTASPIGGPVQQAYEQLGTDFARRGAQVAQQAAGPGGEVIFERGPLGSFLRQSAQGAGERFQQRIGQLDTALDNAIGPTTRVDAPNVRALISEYEQRLAADPNTMGPILRGPLERLKRVAADVDQSGGIQFGTIRKERTALGQDLARPDISGYSGAGGEFWTRAYGALAQDINAAAKAAGPDAEKASQLMDRYVRMQRGTGNIDFLTQLAEKGTDVQAANFALSGTREGVSNLAKLRRNLKPEEWDTVVASTIQQLGTKRSGATGSIDEVADFDMLTFANNWEKMSNSAKKVLFGGSRYERSLDDLEDLFKIASAGKAASGKLNFSNTTNNAIWTLLGAGAIESVGSSIDGTPAQGLTAGTVVGLVSGRTMLKLMESPRFVKWVTDGTKIAQNNPNGLGPWLGRLGTIYADEKEIRPELNEYYGAISPRLQAMGVRVEEPQKRR
jgi:hypothetical protein